MFDTRLLRTLPELATPVLTVYLDTNPANPRNLGRPSGAGAWVKTHARELATRLTNTDPQLIKNHAQRIDAYLDDHLARAKGLIFFAGAKSWKIVRLQVPVEDEIYWGKPSLGQLMWILDEHQPHGVLVVDRNGARFFRYWLGEIEEQKQDRFELDLSQWRRRVFVAGPTEAAEATWNELPETCRAQGALVRGLPARVTGPELQRRLEPEIEAWKRARELEDVVLAAGEGPRASLGIDTTLARIQQGEVRSLLVVRGLSGRVRVYRQCGWVDRNPEDTCHRCGGARETESLRTAFPELAHARNIPIEVVAGPAAERLRSVDGLAAWLANGKGSGGN